MAHSIRSNIVDYKIGKIIWSETETWDGVEDSEVVNNDKSRLDATVTIKAWSASEWGCWYLANDYLGMLDIKDEKRFFPEPFRFKGQEWNGKGCRVEITCIPARKPGLDCQLVLKAMAKTFLEESWETYISNEDEDRREKERSGEIPFDPVLRPRPAMPTPSKRLLEECDLYALDLYERIRIVWSSRVDAIVEPWKQINEYAYRRRGKPESYLDVWGHYAVMSCIGHGVSWEDSHDPILWIDSIHGKQAELDASYEREDKVTLLLSIEAPQWEAEEQSEIR
mgnify:FL=1